MAYEKQNMNFIKTRAKAIQVGGFLLFALFSHANVVIVIFISYFFVGIFCLSHIHNATVHFNVNQIASAHCVLHAVGNSTIKTPHPNRKYEEEEEEENNIKKTFTHLHLITSS